MSSSTLIEVFGHIVFRFTRSVTYTEHYNPDEPEFTSETFSYNPLESTGREWYCQPVDELIYQEYSIREATCLDYLEAPSSLNVRVINACSTEQETKKDQQDEERAMAWKRLRPSALQTVCKSMYIGALISLLVATFIGTLYTLISYVRYETYLSYLLDCQFHMNDSFSVKIQWTRTVSGVIECGFFYIWLFTILLFLFRPFQLMGMKGKLFLVCFLVSCLDALYRVTLQALTLSHVKVSSFLTWFPLNALFVISVCLQLYVVTNHFCTRSRKKKLTLFFQMIVPGCLPLLVGQIGQYFLYPAYNMQKTNEGKLLIALCFSLVGVVIKIISRICVQRLYRITHPGYSYVLLLPLYSGWAIMHRVLQAELDGPQYIAILGIIHGAAEVIERSTMVLIDYICYMLWKRKSAPWGSFRTPRRERLMADIVIMSMMSESTAIVSVNGFIYMYQFICLQDRSIVQLLHTFAIYTSVPLVIEWFFTSVSLAIATRYQNMAVMAVWRRRWKRHILVAIVNVVPLAIYTSEDLLKLVRGQLSEVFYKTCKMPFT